MRLRYITCSDPREHNSIQDIIELSKLPYVEIAIQCHPSKMSIGMPRNIWFNDLLHVADSDMNLAIHINQEWANDICANAKIPDIILNWIKLEHQTNQPIIKRIQLNMPHNTAQHISVNGLAQIIHNFPNQEFILQYNDKTKPAVEKLYQTGAKFSLLFDASGGNGKTPENWQKPVYENHSMGYSGGMSPDNVIENLEQISRVVPEHRDIWIDAEGKLKSPQQLPDGTYKDLFDTNKAKLYVQHANAWQNQKIK